MAFLYMWRERKGKGDRDRERQRDRYEVYFPWLSLKAKLYNNHVDCYKMMKDSLG